MAQFLQNLEASLYKLLIEISVDMNCDLDNTIYEIISWVFGSRIWR
jgi:hypothetical protein